MSALKFIYGDARPLWRDVNNLAAHFLEWDELSEETSDYLRNIMALENV
jgi:hypothetical protein